MTIPQILHQIWWQGKDRVPGDYPNYSRTWAEKHPSFRYSFWDQSSITTLVREYPLEVQRVFNELPHMIQKIDMAKFLILFKHGGLYVDMDSECLKPVTELIQSQEIVLVQINVDILAKFLGYGKLTGEALQNGIMAGEARHPFWTHCLKALMQENMKQRVYETRLKYVFRSTGPGLLTEAYNSYTNKHQISLLPHTKVDSVSYCDYELYDCGKQSCAGKFPNAYSLHHFGSKHKGASWLTNKERGIAMFYCRYQGVIKPALFVLATVVAFRLAGFLSKRLTRK